MLIEKLAIEKKLPISRSEAGPRHCLLLPLPALPCFELAVNPERTTRCPYVLDIQILAQRPDSLNE